MKALNWILAVIALLATGAAVLRWQTMSRLRAESNVTAETNEITAPPAPSPSDSAETAALREQTKDLARLRNEIGQLRAATNEIAALQKENERLAEAKRTGAVVPAPVPAGFVTREQLADAGMLTPDATAQTFFWAVRETNFNRVIESWSERMKQKERVNDPQKRARLEADFLKGSADMMRRFNNFGVVEREHVSPTEHVLHIRSSFGTRTMKMRMVFEDNAWRIDNFE